MVERFKIYGVFYLRKTALDRIKYFKKLGYKVKLKKVYSRRGFDFGKQGTKRRVMRKTGFQLKINNPYNIKVLR